MPRMPSAHTAECTLRDARTSMPPDAQPCMLASASMRRWMPLKPPCSDSRAAMASAARRMCGAGRSCCAISPANGLVQSYGLS